MDALVRGAARALGVPPDLLRIAFCILGSFPLSSLVKRIPPQRAALKDACVLAAGVFFLAGVFNLVWGTLLLLALSAATYALAAAFPARPWMPWANFVLQMGLMLATHCYEQLGGGDFVNDIGVSGTQMIVVQKLTSYAWDVYDGTQPVDAAAETAPPSDDKAAAASSTSTTPAATPAEKAAAARAAHAREARITARPCVLRYLAWVFFFPTIMTGPACTYMEYSNWSDESMFRGVRGRDGGRDGSREGSRDGGAAPGRMPRSGFVVMGLKVLEGLLWVGLYTQSSGANFDFVHAAWYAQTPFWGRVGYVYIVALLFRTKYYAAWLLAEAACMHVGIAFNGVNEATGKLRWNRMQNVRPLGVETAQNIRGVFADWNIITAQWLRVYVYERVTPAGRKPGARSTFITFLVSALWHGTRPGYYLTFVTGAVYQTFGKLFRRNLRPVFVGTGYKRIYDVATWVATQLALSFAVVPFLVLNLTPALEVWASVRFYVFVALLVSWFLLAGPGRGLLLPKLRMMHRNIQKLE